MRGQDGKEKDKIRPDGDRKPLKDNKEKFKIKTKRVC
jgi:hypothetical protein